VEDEDGCRRGDDPDRGQPARGSLRPSRRRGPQSSYLLTGDGALAEDLVQDAFVRGAGRLLHLRDPGGFHAYLQKTIVNLARSHYRRRAVERRYLERQTEAPPTDPDDLSDRERLRRALMALPIGQRTAIVLRYFEDLSEA
jgi:RNA polymerase sigma factor (sigma-70 family)